MPDGRPIIRWRLKEEDMKNKRSVFAVIIIVLFGISLNVKARAQETPPENPY
jgi:hypothetical protein